MFLTNWKCSWNVWQFVMSAVLENGRTSESIVIKFTIKLTKTEETLWNSSKLGQRRSRSTGRGPVSNRPVTRCPTRDRSAESHLSYRACATNSNCRAAQVLGCRIKTKTNKFRVYFLGDFNFLRHQFHRCRLNFNISSFFVCCS